MLENMDRLERSAADLAKGPLQRLPASTSASGGDKDVGDERQRAQCVELLPPARAHPELHDTLAL